MSGCGCKNYGCEPKCCKKQCCEPKCCPLPAPQCEKVKCLKVTEKLTSACETDLHGVTRVDALQFACPVECNCNKHNKKNKNWTLKSTCDEDDLLVFQRRSGCGKTKSVAALTPAGILLQSSENNEIASNGIFQPSPFTRYTFLNFKGAFSAEGRIADGVYDGQEKTVAIFGAPGMQYTLKLPQGALPEKELKLTLANPAVQLVWSEIANHWIPLTGAASA
jgi:hypothetical protein